ncbi:MAG: hypothetical protein NVS3B12_16540 [Acidimicrobiales bacterium]
MSVTLTLDGRSVEIPDDGSSLLEALRDRLGERSVKDGCSPQGQCGCCTVLVDGHPRVACVTPVRRVAGRAVTTLRGLDPGIRERLVAAFVDHGASQCGFCTPGIIVRLAALGPTPEAPDVERALLAHLCRCTGWRSIIDAAVDGPMPGERDLVAAGRRASLEGGSPQTVGPEVVWGDAGFADDLAPVGALVAVPKPDGGWAVAATLVEARTASGKVQGRRTTAELTWPVSLPAGSWALTLQTTWVEPAYLEPDASWCTPGGTAATPLANGGAFGAKMHSSVVAAAEALAAEHGEAVRVVLAREDVVRLGPKRPPMAIGLRADGTGVIRVARTPGIAEAIALIAPGVEIEEVDVAGPPTSVTIRAAGWAEAAVMLAALRGDVPAVVRAPSGAWASAQISERGIEIVVAAGETLDEVVLRSYCTGAAHQALGWVTSEGLTVDDVGVVHDLTIRSFGVLRAQDMPPVAVTIAGPATTEPYPVPEQAVNGSDAVFAAVAAAVWIDRGLPARWPTDCTHSR